MAAVQWVCKHIAAAVTRGVLCMYAWNENSASRVDALALAKAAGQRDCN